MLMTTVSERLTEEELQEEVPEGAAPESLRRQMRTCASSITAPVTDFLKPVTVRARVAGTKAAHAANTRDSLLHSQPPTFAEAWAQHKEHAGRHEGLLLKVPRHVWAVIHMTLKAVLNALEWVTATPARFVIASAILTVLLIWG